MVAFFNRFQLNTVLPDIWIIEEQLRRERERHKRESIPLEIPVSLPEQGEYLEHSPPKREIEKERIVIIEL